MRKGEWLGSTVAVKFFKSKDAESQLKFLKEVNLVCNLNHPNVIHCYGGCKIKEDEFCMVMEYLPFTLSDILPNPLSLQQVLSISKGISSGMNYLHQLSIIHRDLKPSNILLDQQFHPKIADFGISRSECESTMTSIGTPYYMAPEMIASTKYDHKVDVYSFAMVLLQLFTKDKLYNEFPDRSPLTIAYHVVQRHVRPFLPNFIPKKISTLIQTWLVI